MKNPTTRIVLATDLAPSSDRVAEVAVALAAKVGATLDVIYVLDETSLGRALEELPEDQAFVDVVVDQRKQAMREQVRRIPEGAELEVRLTVVEGEPGEAILGAQGGEANCLLVIGRRSRSRVGKFLLGSVTQHIIMEARCPVVSVPISQHRDD